MGGAISSEPAIGSAADGLAGRRRYAAVVAVSLGAMLVSIDNGSVNIALPTLARDLQVEPSAAVLLVTVYQLVLIMTVLPLAALGERIGHRTVYQYGQMVFIAATLLCFVADSLPFLVLIRVFQALGAAASLGVSAALIRSIYPQSQLGRGTGLYTVVAATSSAIAPTVGGLILSVASWPWLFAATVPLGLLALLIGRRALPEPQRQEHPYDVAAALMCAAMFGVAVAGLESAVRGRSPLLSAGLIALALAIGVVFVRREAGQTRPVLPVDLLRHRQFALGSIAALAGFVGPMMVLLTLPFRLQEEFGYSPAEAGLILGVWPMVMMVAAPASGMLSDRVRPGLLGSIGMGIAIAGMSSLAFLPPAPDHANLSWRLALAALGFGLFHSPNARQLIGSVPIERAAAAGALGQTTRMTGQVLGATTAAALLAKGLGAGSTPPLVAAALALFTGLCSLAMLTSERGRGAPSRP
jgi:DHA2 family multidrug resistance protein-like MFS transporter